MIIFEFMEFCFGVFLAGIVIYYLFEWFEIFVKNYISKL